VKENVPILMNALNVINLVIGPVIALRMEVVEETEIVIGAEGFTFHFSLFTFPFSFFFFGGGIIPSLLFSLPLSSIL